MTESGVALRAIVADDAEAVGAFLHRHLNPAVTPAAWEGLIRPPWGGEGANSGYLLATSGDGTAAETIVGVYAAVYSHREVDRVVVPVCNLAAFCVLEDFRTHSLRLVRALLKQPGYLVTDLSPSGNVIAMNERLGFQRIDTSTRVVLNLPSLPRPGIRLHRDPDRLERVLQGRDAKIYRDHRHAAAAEHLLIENGDRHAYLMFRRDRRKGLRLFATPLFAGGDRELLASAWSAVGAHLLAEGLPFTLAERRVLGFSRGPGRELANPRPKMFRGDGIPAADIDYLYSELALVAW